ncbi:MAG: hypothetical protein LKKZDAJK_002532 [Candidatus Fervidibacter sp.]
MRRAMALAALCGLVIGGLWAQQSPQPKTEKVTLLIPATR